MRSYIAYIRTSMALTMRDKLVLFFNYLFPLVFFFAFGEGFGAKTSSGAIAQVLSMVLMFGVLGTGFFGAGMRATMDRESGILRRFKVAPITPGPIIASGIFTGWILFLPSVIFFVVIAHFRYKMAIPANMISLLVVVSLGVIAFRAVGLIIAAVVNSMAESQIIVQLLYLPMLMLSGATVPLSIMPEWLQSVAQFLPSTHLYLAMQGVIVRGESAWQNAQSLGALLLTSIVGVIISAKLFRWEKEEKLKPTAKFWVLGVLAPFIVIGAWQAHSKENLRKTKILSHQMRRAQTYLIRDGRLFLGDGRVIERGAILVRDGKIEQIIEGSAPPAKSLNADDVEASGKTILPGFIDTRVELMLDGTGTPNMESKALEKSMTRALAAYLYSGVTAVRSAPDPLGLAPQIKARVDSGEVLASELILEPGQAPPLSLVAASAAAGDTSFLKDSLLQQVSKPAVLERIRAMTARATPNPEATAKAGSALMELYKTGAPLILGTRSGIPLVPPGPAIHREMKLWTEAGVPVRDVLKAATSNAAKAIGAGGRMGLIHTGYEATLVIVEGNPLEDIAATSRLRSVMLKGEMVNRDSLFEADKEDK